MDKLKQFLKWGLLSVILQCLVLFVFDKFYFKLNSDVNVKAIDIASQHTKENNDVKLPGNMMDKKISYDGEYIAYLNNNDELKVFNTLKDDEKLSDVAKKFKDTCTVNSSLNIIKSLNQISNTSSLESGDTVLVPVNAFQDGKKYSVKEGDTWYSIARKHYPKYNHEVVIDFLMDINPFKNDILPLGEDIFLPNI